MKTQKKWTRKQKVRSRKSETALEKGEKIPRLQAQEVEKAIIHR